MEYGLFVNGVLLTGGYNNPVDAYKGAIFAYEETGLFHEVKLIKRESIETPSALVRMMEEFQKENERHIEMINEIQIVLDSPLTDWVEIHDAIQDILKKVFTN